MHGRIKTTEAKAKAIRGEVEKLITYAKNKPENAEHYLQKHVHPKTVQGIISIAPVFANRPGGYTRIIRIGNRKKDNSSMVILEFVEKTDIKVVKEPKKEKKAATAPKNNKKEATVKKETKKKASPKKEAKKDAKSNTPNKK